jgi:transcriptional regulator with XRE-family HTH domain
MGKESKKSGQNNLFMEPNNVFTKVNSSYEEISSGRVSELMKTVMLPIVLREQMEARGLHVRTLAKACKIPVSTISTYLSGKKASYSPEHLRSLSEFFGISIDYLLYRKTNLPSGLDLLKTENVFTGWLKVKIERAIPDVPNRKDEEDV